jgi:hypothetical protein
MEEDVSSWKFSTREDVVELSSLVVEFVLPGGGSNDETLLKP